MNISIDTALCDPELLGAALGDPASWSAWTAVLKAAHGLKLTTKELLTFSTVASRPPPKAPVNELFVLAGRGSGKSRMAAAAAVHAATCVDYRGKLAPGETGMVLVLALSQQQAKSVLNYCVGFLRESPILSQQIEQVTSDEIRLKGNITIAVHSNSFRSIRSPTLICCVFDECSFWMDENSANSDLEVYRAVIPALMRKASGQLIAISSPYRKAGLMYNKFKAAFGMNDSRVLVVRAPSALLNPTVDKIAIEQMLADDPEAARSEWLAEWRSDLSGYLDDKSIDDAIDNARPLELPPREGIKYFTFVDMSGGRADFSTACVAHLEGERVVVDVIRGRAGDPAAATEEFAALASQYRCGKVVGDNYAAELVAGPFRKLGKEYTVSDLVRSGVYLTVLPQWTRGNVSIPNHTPTIRELRMLERKVARSGKDSVDHPPGQHDDHANALCGAIYLAAESLLKPKPQVPMMSGRRVYKIRRRNVKANPAKQFLSSRSRRFIFRDWRGNSTHSPLERRPAIMTIFKMKDFNNEFSECFGRSPGQYNCGQCS